MYIVDGLLRHGVQVVVYACDGTGVERSVEYQFISKATRIMTYKIKHPGENPQSPYIPIEVPFYGEDASHPIACVQDAKHGLKTFRNNLFSGASSKTLGNHLALYRFIQMIAFADDGSIYMRDVNGKLDRQDDNAATRLFSGATLELLVRHRPDLLGVIVYLFVFGELIDAYQNRHISHRTRVQMVLRAMFFVDMWEEFLVAAKYPKAKHFLSHEARDITRFLVRGFFQMIFIFRDHVPGRYPLLPWLLSTETCEHVFGICRQIVKDFTMLDLYHMVPKLFIKLREAAFSAHASDGKARAHGYNHTYTDAQGIDLVSLSTYPTDDEINDAARIAYGEAENLFSLLGISVSQLGTSAGEHPERLPSIRSWFATNADNPEAPGDLSDDVDDGVESDGEDDEENYQDLLDDIEDMSFSTVEEEHRVMDRVYASIALSVDDYIRM